MLNGLLFLALMMVTEKSASLDLRRASKLLEVLAIVHTLSALFANALDHRADAHVRADVWLYLGAAGLFMCWRPFAPGGGCWWAAWRVAPWVLPAGISAWCRASRLLWAWD